MLDSRISKFAKVLVHYSLGVKKDDSFLISGNAISEPLLKEVYKEALIAGANPFINTILEGVNELLYKYGSDEQIGYLSPHEKFRIENIDAFLTVVGNLNTRALTNIAPAKQALRHKGHREIGRIHAERRSSGALRWCGTLFPTYAGAMDGDMSLMEYEEFVFDACKLNSDDPIAEWKKVSEEQQKYVDWLNTKSTIEVKSKDTHLTLSTAGRKWINCDGRVNFPDGEVFTSPVENSMNGHVRYSFPAVHMGKEVEDIELTFENGKVVKATAKKGEEFLHEMLKIDEGASLVGEFAIGTNYNIKKFTKNILFDEKIGGTIHIAIGRSLPDTGGQNLSSIHWDMICDMRDGGEIYADGELFYKDGKFLI